MVARLVELRDQKRPDGQGFREIRCGSCGSAVRFVETIASSECAYCGGPLQLEDAYDAPHRVPVDGVLPFAIERGVAHENLRDWVRSRWFAPNNFKERSVDGRFNGVYAPFWTIDSMTSNRYSGARGDYYYVTVGSGKNRRQVRRTRWTPACGAFQRFFDDVLVAAATGLPKKRVDALEPWPLKECAPFNREMLAGFLARTYDVELEVGFSEARGRMDETIAEEVRRRIGGDTQRIDWIKSRYDAITYKHLLLPLWMLAYRYAEKPFQVVVNACTGEVQGDRPYSWVKILLAILGGLTLVAGIWYFVSQR
jgi:hypothetical protein